MFNSILLNIWQVKPEKEKSCIKSAGHPQRPFVGNSACGQGVVVVLFPPMTSQLGQIPRSGVKDGRVSSRRSRSACGITAKIHIFRGEALNSRFCSFNAPRSSNSFALETDALVATIPSRLIRNRRYECTHEARAERRPARDSLGHTSRLDRTRTGAAFLYTGVTRDYGSVQKEHLSLLDLIIKVVVSVALHRTVVVNG